ncbi:hypothetical protein RJ639_000447 [Escallonia herrerae]|uniref:CW-type domain-containing protein n=1 Tax=Escallonia herrerae TaxID=1293975 RepID=A0AA88XFM8_9ASTE|nr:hypothetical protein RJ639_000447 [Escallonia herrerae]
MEEAELEEGEAYQNDEAERIAGYNQLTITVEYCSAIHSTIGISHNLYCNSFKDEKLQHVLGHFQKDFEGGVSAENLGAKFGGYGSFLPTYQRSPAWSHPRTPTKGHNDNTPSSPKNLHTEGAGRDNFIVSSSASRLTRPGLASLSAASVPAVRAPSLNGSVKQDVSMSSTRAEEFTSKCEPLNKFTNPSDQKSLKVRIKVGSDNLSTQKNAEIYSGLGLDVSPSSSLDGSPTDSEGLSREPQGAPDESPTSILQLMTSFPVCGSLLLSPLSNDLIRFSEKEKHWERKSVPVHKGNQETPAITMNGYDSARSDRKVKGEKKPRPSERNVFPVESKNGNDYAAQNGIGTTTKEKGIDASACDEIVSNALRLPLLSNASCHVVDSAKDISTVASTGGVKEEYFSDLPQEEVLEPVSVNENGWVEKFNGRAGSDGNHVENKIAIPSIEDSFNPRKGENFRGEKSDAPAKADSNASKGSRCPSAELIDPLKQNAGQKATSHEENATKLAPEKELSSSSGRRKSKGSQSLGGQVVELPKDGSSIDTSSAPKSRTSTQPNNSASKSKVEDFRRDYGKDRDRYKDFFGDLEPEDIDNEIALEELPYTDGPKDYLVGEKSTFKHESPSKGRLSVKNVDVPSTSKAYPRATSIAAPLSGNGPTSDAAATGAPVVKEDWVCCDKCQKWRLLPNGKNPESLPEKWLCSMLDWL